MSTINEMYNDDDDDNDVYDRLNQVDIIQVNLFEMLFVQSITNMMCNLLVSIEFFFRSIIIFFQLV